jgi:2-oxoglutarate ferredoxin oxidoreductase subunit beta
LAFAVGVKAARPDLKPVVISGDGDLFAIGGNHFIHAARRNVDVAVICSNNFNYGMTGGQSGPTTPIGAFTTTSRYGNIEHPFNLAHLAAASGAVYVARWTAIHVKRIRESMKKAITKKGFSFVEIITPCPEEYGRRNKIADPILGMKWLREVSEVRSNINPIDAVVGPDKIVVGEFVNVEKPEYSDLLWGQNQSIQAGLDKTGRRTNVTL